MARNCGSGSCSAGVSCSCTGSKRVFADGFPDPCGGLHNRCSSNVAARLRHRETGGDASFTNDRFRAFRLLEEHDTYDAASIRRWELYFLRKRSKVVEIAVAEGIIFVLTRSGVCTALHRDSKRRLCFLNTMGTEVVRSMYYNKAASCVVTISVLPEDNYSSLVCRSIPIGLIRSGCPEQGSVLFGAEPLRWPGFVEFDDVNAVLLKCSAENRVYRVYDLAEYRQLHFFSNELVRDVKMSPGLLLLVLEPVAGKLPLVLRDVRTGHVLAELDWSLHPDYGLPTVVEHFHERLLVQQERGPLELADLRSGAVRVVGPPPCGPGPHSPPLPCGAEQLHRPPAPPPAFICLQRRNAFLACMQGGLALLDAQGTVVCMYDPHLAWPATLSSISITRDERHIISYCGQDPAAPHSPADALTPLQPPQRPAARGEVHAVPARTATPSIHVSDVATGRSVARLAADMATDPGEHKALTKALADVTALFFDEERNELFTGNGEGKLCIWGQ